jgi:hypothetical protein
VNRTTEQKHTIASASFRPLVGAIHLLRTALLDSDYSGAFSTPFAGLRLPRGFLDAFDLLLVVAVMYSAISRSRSHMTYLEINFTTSTGVARLKLSLHFINQLGSYILLAEPHILVLLLSSPQRTKTGMTDRTHFSFGPHRLIRDSAIKWFNPATAARLVREG